MRFSNELWTRTKKTVSKKILWVVQGIYDNVKETESAPANEEGDEVQTNSVSERLLKQFFT